MNELTGKDKAIAQALEAYGYQFWGFDEPDDEAFTEYLQDLAETTSLVGIFKNWTITKDMNCICAEESGSKAYWLKACDKCEAKQIFEASVNLIRGAATAWDEAQGQLKLFEGEDYAIAPPSTAVNC